MLTIFLDLNAAVNNLYDFILYYSVRKNEWFFGWFNFFYFLWNDGHHLYIFSFGNFSCCGSRSALFSKHCSLLKRIQWLRRWHRRLRFFNDLHFILFLLSFIVTSGCLRQASNNLHLTAIISSLLLLFLLELALMLLLGHSLNLEVHQSGLLIRWLSCCSRCRSLVTWCYAEKRFEFI